MDTAYSNLFWTTGMPEAWLMSREGNAVPPSGALQGGGQGLPGLWADSPAPLMNSVPGSLRNLY